MIVARSHPVFDNLCNNIMIVKCVDVEGHANYSRLMNSEEYVGKGKC